MTLTQPSPGPLPARVETVDIRDFVADDAAAFRSLNEEWIRAYFSIEAPDIEVLGDPEGAILRPGGRILMAVAGAQPVGCCALLAEGDRVYELAKMAVAPAWRGRGLGRRLLRQVLATAREMGARRVWLGSNRRLADALHLYESIGFRACPPPHASPYSRADVFMEMDLAPEAAPPSSV